MNRMKKILSLAVAAVLLTTGLTACGDKEDDGKQDPSAVSNKVTDVYKDKAYGFQLEQPAEGDTVAIMHTSMGDISIRFFPEAAPKAVENFTTHAKNGYYNGLSFHRVLKDFMIQGGDPKGNGTGGESIWKENFDDEFDKKLLNLRGSLSMANSGPKTNGSQFFINQVGPSGKSAGDTKAELVKTWDSVRAQYEQGKKQYGETFTGAFPNVEAYAHEASQGTLPIVDKIPDEVFELYAKHGGNIHLDGAWRYAGGHTVFGQVYDGMDVVDAIAAVKVDDSGKPAEPVTIQSIDVQTYKKSK